MKVKLFLAGLLCVAGSFVHAQDSVAVSDDEIHRYAVMMDSVERMRTRLVAQISEIVRNSKEFTVQRYNELYKIVDDSTKLAAVNATPEEINAVKAVKATRDAGSETINTTYKALAKDYVGLAVYNKIRKALNTDAEIKSRYQAAADKLKQEHGS